MGSPQDWKVKCTQNEELARKEAVQQCLGLMQMQAEIYKKRLQAGGSVAYDVLLSDYRASLEQQIAAIGRVMGICDAAITDPAVLAFLAAMMRYLHDKPDKDMGITRMHDTHSQKQ